MEFLRKTIRVGNSSGVILPKSLLGSEVKITVVKRPLNIKKEAIDVLKPYFEDLRGVYVINRNPIEILAVSTKLKSIIKNEKMKVSLVPLNILKRDINKPALKAKLMNAETILNRALLTELKKEI